MIMLFENTLRRFFGDKARGFEGWANNKQERKKEFLKIVKLLIGIIDKIEAPTRQKKILMFQLEKLEECIKKQNEDNFIVLILLNFIGIIFGYTSGKRYYDLCYFQSENQYYSEKVSIENDLESYLEKDRKDIISIREDIIIDLKSRGYDSFKISVIFNISEYEVKKILINKKHKE